ncbi:MAG TPA: hypothetical protein VLA50_03510, partial [Erythrobacter sp.]|nr:hypothetical protein [Erythrobacter sp.]
MAKTFRTQSPPVLRDVAAGSQLRLLTLTEVEQPPFIAAWERLVAQVAEPNPFFEPWFLIPSLRQWGAGERVVDDQVAVGAWYHQGRLSGLMPTVRTSAYYGHTITHAKGWLHPNAFCGVPLIAAGHEDAFWRALMAHFDRMARRALFLHLPLLPADGPVSAALDRVLSASGRAHYTVAEESRALLAGDASAADYLEAAMSAKKRKELRR